MATGTATRRSKTGRKASLAGGKGAAAGKAISTQAVVRATGRAWPHWHRVLDRFARGRAWAHREAAAHLSKAHGVGPWWSQMVTVEYERARGIRAVNQRAKGFGMDVQRTVDAPAGAAFAAFTAGKRVGPGVRYRDAAGGRGTCLAVEAPRRLRMSWDAPRGSVVEVTFTPKGRDRTVVRVSHERLPHAKAVATLRARWSRLLAAFLRGQ